MAHRITTGKVFINDLRLHAYHGVMPQERVVGQNYKVSVEAEYDLRRAAETDDLRHALNYAAMCQLVESEMMKPSQLLETVAMRVAKSLLREFSEIQTVSVRITKLNPPMPFECAGAGVEVCLTNDKTPQ